MLDAPHLLRALEPLSPSVLEARLRAALSSRPFVPAAQHVDRTIAFGIDQSGPWVWESTGGLNHAEPILTRELRKLGRVVDEHGAARPDGAARELLVAYDHSAQLVRFDAFAAGLGEFVAERFRLRRADGRINLDVVATRVEPPASGHPGGHEFLGRLWTTMRLVQWAPGTERLVSRMADQELVLATVPWLATTGHFVIRGAHKCLAADEVAAEFEAMLAGLAARLGRSLDAWDPTALDALTPDLLLER